MTNDGLGVASTTADAALYLELLSSLGRKLLKHCYNLSNHLLRYWPNLRNEPNVIIENQQ